MKTNLTDEALYLVPKETTLETSIVSEVQPKETVEVTALRQAHRKVFLEKDGTHRAVYYPETVHVLSQDAQTYEEIDNHLFEEQDGHYLRNGRNHFTARFSREEMTDELFHVEKNGHGLIASAYKVGKQHGHGVIPRLLKAAEDKDTVLYERVVGGADLEYTVSGNGVKENIIVREPCKLYRFAFVVTCENLAYEYCEESKQVLLRDPETGDVVYLIPAPFMVDATGSISSDVTYEVKPSGDHKFYLTVLADAAWMGAPERVYPVTIDPQVIVSDNYGLNTYSWNSGNMYSAAVHTVGNVNNNSTSCNAGRMYVGMTLPMLEDGAHIKKALLTVSQKSANIRTERPRLGLYHVTDGIATGACTPVHDTDLLDYAVVRAADGEENVTYTFDITRLTDMLLRGEAETAAFALKLLDESATDTLMLYGHTDNAHAPTLTIDYEDCGSTDGSHRSNTHDLGCFGQGSIDLRCGALQFSAEDFAWEGRRMPVTIRHRYHSALCGSAAPASFGAMTIGRGWRLNLMQSMTATADGYVYTDENGQETHFNTCEVDCCCDVCKSGADSDMTYDPQTRILTASGERRVFDTAGRLIRIEDIDHPDNSMALAYAAGRLTSVTDGVGRVFAFQYEGSCLSAIQAPDGSTVSYTYNNGLLTAVSYPEGKGVELAYAGDLPVAVTLTDHDTPVYKVAYTYTGSRVTGITEYGHDGTDFVTGASSVLDYSAASNRTVMTTTVPADEDETEPSTATTVYTFDDEGNIISQYMYNGTVYTCGTGGQSGIDPYSGDGVQADVPVDNLLLGHGFETAGTWVQMPNNCDEFSFDLFDRVNYAKFGTAVRRMRSLNRGCAENGVYQDSITLPAGSYTFSAYCEVYSAFAGSDTCAPGAYLRVTTADGSTVLAESEHLTHKSTEYVRLAAPFDLAEPMVVRVHILINGEGTVFVDGSQLESNPYAGAYNLMTNGNFVHGMAGWTADSGTVAGIVSESEYALGNCLRISSEPGATGKVRQTVPVKTARGTRESFTLSAWAKGYALPDAQHDEDEKPTFRLLAEIVYKNGETEQYPLDFSTCTDEWQYAAVQFSKAQYRAVESLTVVCDYSHNFGTACFDNICLVRDSIETDLTASDFTVSEETEEEETETEQTLSEEEEAPAFEEATDAYGNALTETTFTDGEFGTIYRSFVYGEDGNDLISETDARGNETQYEVDEETSHNEVVTDRCGNKTAYEYDEAGRTTRVTSKNAANEELANVSYAYDAFDNLTEITRGDGMKYSLAYNAFHNLESIGVQGKSESLVQYTYKNGNGRLKAVTYANGDTMQATYNGLGQMTAEKWYNAGGELTAHYKYAYDGQGNIVRSIDIGCKKEYTYTYEEGRIARAAEYAVTLTADGIVTSKNLVNSILYTYDSEGELTRKCIISADGEEQVIYSEKNDDNTVVKFSAGGQTVTSHSKNDSFGRKVFDELQLGTGFVSRQFSYHAGEETTAHTENGKLKSSPTTALVSQIVLSDGRTIAYEYDAEERITKVTDSVDGITEYTYDVLGQLLTEKHQAVGEETVTVVNEMTYDNYGNILTKNGVVYAYDGTWRDLLTAYNGQPITYDAQGNPTSYLSHTLTWEKGRQLKSFDGNTYTYNANGIRTSKTVDGITHTYTLDGTKILCEDWDGNSIVPLYDNEDSVCGIIYNDEPYYFLKNLQGDTISITNANGSVVAQYTYDAWGVPTIALDSSDCSIAMVNPYRYRGYYYDEEIGLYYLQSRYYNPIVGRFANGDDSTYVAVDGTVLSCNVFAYCKNASSSSLDNSGCNSAAISQGAYQWVYMLSAAVPVIAAAKVGIVAAIKSALAFLWNVFVVVGLVLLVILLIAAICAIAAKVLNLVKEAVRENKYKDASGYVVYVLTRQVGNPDRIFYVGRTKSFKKRMNAHKRNKKPCEGYIIVVCRTYAASRAIEQAVLSACIASNIFAIDKGSVPNGSNRMRGIAKDNVINFKNNLSDLTSLMSCTSESDLLNLMGL